MVMMIMRFGLGGPSSYLSILLRVRVCVAVEGVRVGEVVGNLGRGSAYATLGKVRRIASTSRLRAMHTSYWLAMYRAAGGIGFLSSG
jgi:hypothetical protein